MWVLPLLLFSAFIEPDPLNGAGDSSLLLRGGAVLTMHEAMPVAEAVLVQDGFIVAVGSDEEVSDLAPPGTEVIDLHGKTLLPGFIDSHAHWIGDRGLAGHATPEDAIQAALESGWTSISELFVSQERLDELVSLDEAGRLRLRVNAYLPLSWQFERFGDWYQGYLPGQAFSSKLRIGGVKIFVDGNWGRDVYFSQEELNGLVAEAHQAGFQIATHVLGEASHVDLILDAYENALQGESNEIYRHRIEHLTMVRDDQLERMRSLGIIASLQLTFFNSDWTEDLEDVFSSENVRLVGRWHDLLEAGVPSIGSTDSPWGYGSVGSSMKAVYQVVTRIGEQGLLPRQWMLDQRITVAQALRLITVDAAHGTFQGDVKGSVTPGKYADLVVLSDNPLEVTHEELLDIRVLMTMVGGRIEFLSFESQPALSELEAAFQELQRAYDSLQRDYDGVLQEFAELQTDYDALSEGHSVLQTAYEDLQSQITGLEQALQALDEEKQRLEELLAEAERGMGTEEGILGLPLLLGAGIGGATGLALGYALGGRRKRTGSIQAAS